MFFGEFVGDVWWVFLRGVLGMFIGVCKLIFWRVLGKKDIRKLSEDLLLCLKVCHVF